MTEGGTRVVAPAPRDLVARKALLALLYLAEGAPIGLIWWALPTWLRSDGLEPARIAAIGAAATWPWTLKILVAPVVDLLRGPRFGYRAWLVLAQCGMVATLVPLVTGGIAGSPDRLLVLLVLHGCCAATQDVAIDALAARAIPREHVGSANGWMQVGMLVGRGAFGGGAVLMAARHGERAVLSGLVALLVVTMALATTRVLTPVEAPSGQPPGRGFARRLRRTFGSWRFWNGLALASLAGAGFEVLTGLAGPFLLDRGATEEAVGELFLVPTVLAMALGAAVGGRVSDRVGRVRATALGEAAAALCVLLVAWVAAAPPRAELLLLTKCLVLAVYFAVGFATASLYGLLMSMTDRELAGTQFSAYMSGVNLCYVWSATSASALLGRLGYGGTFAVHAAVSLVSLLLLVPLALGRPGSRDRRQRPRRRSRASQAS